MIMTRGVFFSMHGIFKSLFSYCCKNHLCYKMIDAREYYKNINPLGLSDNHSFAVLSTSAMNCHTSVESIF